ncbi:cysteine-rich CWC family protein [Vogesella oryzae]|uniref:cysteine-rich CWC family protein n=1 Tax=Vogesella oryzae TaxID=1735285 RepID=UPI00158399EE|nr:cysteine-rich CWC family protein [Vogesella oryzae]
MSIASPCIGVCQLDSSGRYCTGCLRTLDEIAGWSQADDTRKQAVLARIAALAIPGTPRALECSRCGQPFHCGTGGQRGGCWCADLPPLLPAEGASADCMCPDCLQALADKH